MGKLDGLVRIASNGNYGLTDDGREALRLMNMTHQAGDLKVDLKKGGTLQSGQPLLYLVQLQP